MVRERLDVVLVRRGLAETRERAHALILSGAVRVDGAPATRPAQSVVDASEVTLIETGPDYVSRGALKLEKALDVWNIEPMGCVALDVGASTGGFTDLLLRRGADRVYAVDVGRGQLHYRLRNDPRVIVMERTNVRTLSTLPERPSLTVMDVSFISVTLALPPVFTLADGQAIVLIKPQFEAGRGQVGKGGVVRDARIHRDVLTRLATWSTQLPWRLTAVTASPIRGPAGNLEFLSRWLPDGSVVTAEAIQRALDEAGDNPERVG